MGDSPGCSSARLVSRIPRKRAAPSYSSRCSRLVLGILCKGAAPPYISRCGRLEEFGCRRFVKNPAWKRIHYCEIRRRTTPRAHLCSPAVFKEVTAPPRELLRGCSRPPAVFLIRRLLSSVDVGLGLVDFDVVLATLALLIVDHVDGVNSNRLLACGAISSSLDLGLLRCGRRRRKR